MSRLEDRLKGMGRSVKDSFDQRKEDFKQFVTGSFGVGDYSEISEKIKVVSKEEIISEFNEFLKCQMVNEWDEYVEVITSQALEIRDEYLKFKNFVGVTKSSISERVYSIIGSVKSDIKRFISVNESMEESNFENNNAQGLGKFFHRGLGLKFNHLFSHKNAVVGASPKADHVVGFMGSLISEVQNMYGLSFGAIVPEVVYGKGILVGGFGSWAHERFDGIQISGFGSIGAKRGNYLHMGLICDRPYKIEEGNKYIGIGLIGGIHLEKEFIDGMKTRWDKLQKDIENGYKRLPLIMYEQSRVVLDNTQNIVVTAVESLIPNEMTVQREYSI
jgi:hypothetical protein